MIFVNFTLVPLPQTGERGDLDPKTDIIFEVAEFFLIKEEIIMIFVNFALVPFPLKGGRRDSDQKMDIFLKSQKTY